ncbi:MAG: endolytic transglycosylase MltG [Candidatus Moranbacteria bacterium]|nr:endolytic transglycosylase MltG [Candidatus Moranbacteria bacterium]
MPNIKRIFIVAIILVLLFGSVFLYFKRQVYFSHGTGNIPQTFEIKSGEGVKDIAENLEKSQLVKNKYYFDYYIWKTNSKGKIQAGKYELRGSMTIPEIVQVVSIGEVVPNETKVTFPEGIDTKQMAEILREKGFDADGFLSKSDCGCGVKTDYDFLKSKPGGANLEGFLFPDTYIFYKDATAVSIISRMLLNFDEKLTSEMRGDIEKSGHSIYEIVAMASILEKEVKSPEDMKIAGGIFWDRIEFGMPLQSCATVAYVLGKEKKQYSYEDTRTSSPYNTYLNKGLPPGPIDNPGMNALRAAAYPTKTDYAYFLTDPETGKTIFSKTIEEHEANKVKYGL